MDQQTADLARFTRETKDGAWRVIAKEGLNVGDKIQVAKRGKVASVTVGARIKGLHNGEALYAILKRTQAKGGLEQTTETLEQRDQRLGGLGRFDQSHQVTIEADKGLASEHGITTTSTTEVDMDQQTSSKGTIDAAVQALIAATVSATKGPMDEARVVELIEQHAVKTVHKTYSVDLTKANGTVERVEGQHKQFAKLLDVVSTGEAVMLVGPAGSGKTSAAKAVAKYLESPFYFTGAVVDRFALLGFRDANSRIVETQFSRAVKEKSLFLFDEIDGSGEDALLSFHAPIDNRIADLPEGRVDVHEGTRFIASANTYGRGADRLYVGRNQLDAATLDRFVVINWEYDLDLERNACSDKAWCARVQAVRAAVEALKVRHVVSMRATFQGAKLLARGLSVREVEDMVVWRGLDSDSRAKVERSL